MTSVHCSCQIPRTSVCEEFKPHKQHRNSLFFPGFSGLVDLPFHNTVMHWMPVIFWSLAMYRKRKISSLPSRSSSASQEVRKISGQNAMWLGSQLRMDQGHRNGLPYQPVIDSVLGDFEVPVIKVTQSPKLSFLLMDIPDHYCISRAWPTGNIFWALPLPFTKHTKLFQLPSMGKISFSFEIP